MADSTLWWLLAGGAVALELLTGTFYLLMIALGMVVGALMAHTGASMTTQLATASLVGLGAVAACYLLRLRRPTALPATADPSVSLDIGGTVQVTAWQPDNTATVRYRGANWTAIPWGGEPEGPGPHSVREMSGSRLVVQRIKEQP